MKDSQKVLTTVHIDRDVRNQARVAGLVLSRILENALREKLEALAQ
jgi:post-segregation antitoxin (ccd killing protein)